MDKLQAYQSLNTLFREHGYRLYMVGGTTRDFLLEKNLTDMDLVTDATPSMMKEFLEGDYTFEKMGSIKTTFNGIKFDITTLRKEKKYKDFRHPTKIKFVKKLKQDVKRRDFTINGLYLDENYKVIDYVHGIDDLNGKVIRTIGNAKKRIKEDPLRILRALRFALIYKFDLDEDLIDAICKYKTLLTKLSKDKIKQEIKKIIGVDKKDIINLFNKFAIQSFLNVVE